MMVLWEVEMTGFGEYSLVIEIYDVIWYSRNAINGWMFNHKFDFPFYDSYLKAESCKKVLYSESLMILM